MNTAGTKVAEIKVMRPPDFLDQLFADPHGYPCPANDTTITSKVETKPEEVVPEEKGALVDRLTLMVAAFNGRDLDYNIHFDLDRGKNVTILLIHKSEEPTKPLQRPLFNPFPAAEYNDETKEIIFTDECYWSSATRWLKKEIMKAFGLYVI